MSAKGQSKGYDLHKRYYKRVLSTNIMHPIAHMSASYE